MAWWHRLGALVALVVALLVPATALAADPATEVAGSGRAWLGGEVTSQAGMNCIIVGTPYTEIMVQSSGSYGGTVGIPTVGEAYWVSVLVSVPGNPCGPGVSLVQTDVVLPSGTAYDPSRPIRCFGKPRSSNTFGELTGGRWSFNGSAGDWCPSSVGSSWVAPGGLAVGYRPLASGQMYQLFLPVRSTQALSGIGGNQAFYWYTTATGVYANPAPNRTWATVLPSGYAGAPQFVESRAAVQPFWRPTDKTDGTRSKIEVWVNLATGGQAGELSCWALRADNTRIVCPQVFTIPAGASILQIIPATAQATGPNGGWVPMAFPKPDWGASMTFMWRFRTASGSSILKSIPFTVLNGPDRDGDRVADAADSCPDVQGTLADGCLPAIQADADRDGIFGAADLCPTVDGKGAFNGCPGGVVGASQEGAGGQSGARGSGAVTGPAVASLKRPVVLRVLARGKGTITAIGRVSARASRLARVPRVVARGRAVVKKPGIVVLRLVPTAAARRAAAALKGESMAVTVKLPGRGGTSVIAIALG